MMESKMWGTSKMSYQDLGETRLVVKHAKPVNTDLAAGRTMHIESIYIDNKAGERFRYPVRHLNGARAMAQHIGHGGNPYDAIGQHVVSLSEEMAKLRMFKGYVSRTPVVSEAMGTVNGKVIERIETIKKQLHQLQNAKHYEAFAEGFAPDESKEIPEKIMLDWVDRLTVRSFKEELKDVFPYIYKLVDESELPVAELDPEDVLAKDTVITDSYIANYRADDEFKEAEDFENFMNSLLEADGEKADVMSGDANAIQQLKDAIAQGELIGDANQSNAVSQFFNDDETLAHIINNTSGNDDAWPIIKAWLNQENPDIGKEIFPEEEGEETDAPAPEGETPAAPAPEAPAPEAPAPETSEPAAAEPAAAAAPMAESGDDVAPWYKDKAEQDADKPKQLFKKKVKPGHEMDRARALAQKFAKKGATPDTKIGESTLGALMAEYGLTPEECGMTAPGQTAKNIAEPTQPKGNSYEDMKKYAKGFYNPEKENFIPGGTGMKIKIDKQFPGANPKDKARIMHDIERADPSSSLHEAERILRLAGLKGN